MNLKSSIKQLTSNIEELQKNVFNLENIQRTNIENIAKEFNENRTIIKFNQTLKKNLEGTPSARPVNWVTNNTNAAYEFISNQAQTLLNQAKSNSDKLISQSKNINQNKN